MTGVATLTGDWPTLGEDTAWSTIGPTAVENTGVASPAATGLEPTGGLCACPTVADGLVATQADPDLAVPGAAPPPPEPTEFDPSATVASVGPTQADPSATVAVPVEAGAGTRAGAATADAGLAAGQAAPRPVHPASFLRYRIVQPHAKGGLGEVFIAIDSELSRESR